MLAKYYDLIASLPQLPHFTKADRLPITDLRLTERLRRLRPAHAEQLARVRQFVGWRPERLSHKSDEEIAAAYSAMMELPLETSLREYVVYRMEQKTLLAALRRKRDRRSLPENTNSWGVGPRVHDVRRHWDSQDFGLAHIFRWLPQARELLASGDARGLEQLLMDDAWRRLTQFAERDMFGFDAVFAYEFKWDILRAWLTCDANRGRIRFTELIDQVTYVEHN